MIKVLVYALAGLHEMVAAVEKAITDHSMETVALTDGNGAVKAEVLEGARKVAAVSLSTGQHVLADLAGAGEAAALAALSAKVGPANATLIVSLAGSVVSSIAAQEAAAKVEPVTDVVGDAVKAPTPTPAPVDSSADLTGDSDHQVIPGTALDS